MLDVKNLTDTMSRMPLPQLQQYAALHKNDPYIVTLALSIANQKKQVMLSKDGQAGMMPQPKVVDQDIAQMVAPSQPQMPPQQMPPQQMATAPQQQALPEDQGIGQLPAQNMQRMAEGGIVAFDAGGDVPSFAGPAGSYIDPLAEYLKQIGMSAQEFIAKTGTEQQQIRTAATAAKPVVPPPAVPVAQAAASAPVKPSGLGGLSKAVAPLAAITDLMYPATDTEKKMAYPYKLGAQSAVDEQNTRVANAKESAEAYAARKIKEFEATLPAGQKLSPEARNKETDRLIAEKVAAELTAKRQPIDPTGQNPVDPIKSASLKTDKGYNNPPVSGQTVVGQDGSQPPVSGVAAPAAVAASSADADFMAGINKLLKSSQTGGSGRYDVTAPQLANATPKDMADRLAAAMGPNPTESPFAAQQTELNKANVATRQNAAKDLEEHFKNQGEAFKGTLEKLTSKEARVKTMEDNQLGMSMFEAGLAMMAGDSPYAMVNIGKGAQVGTKKYMELQDKIEGARDKIDDAKMKIEEFRRNEANMNARELRLAKRDVDDAVSSGAQASLNLMRENYGLKHAEGLAFVSNSYALDRFNIEQKTSYAQMGNARDIAAMQTKAHLGLAALEAKYRAANPAAGSLNFYKQLATNPEAIKGMKLYSESLGPEAKGVEADILDWSKKSEADKMLARKMDPMGSALKDRKLQERLLQGSVSDKPAGKVLD